MSRVRLVNITKRFGNTTAVSDVNMDIAEGEFVTLLGPSGCGKTTTLRMIAGLVEPTEGKIYFDEQLVNPLPPNRRNIGFVFQTHSLFPHMNVTDNIGFGLSVKGEDKQKIAARVQEMLALIGLQGYEKRMPSELSGGQQQRVALARVLATNPRVLLFDEPLSALDRNLRDQLKYNILDLQRKTHKTAIYVTHDQSEAFAISDRIFVMNLGRVEQVGTQLDIYLHPQTEFVAEFIGSNNTLAGEVIQSSDGAGERQVSVQAGNLTIQCRDYLGLKTGDHVLAFIRPENIRVLDNASSNHYLNQVEGTVEKIVFEGSTVHFDARVQDTLLRVELAGTERLTILNREGARVRLGFDEVTLIRRN
ncbi:MAG TPA: ABC transporter ATP-binding protein [Anaerolineae bacterium]|nr:ABC transporter ATP-binding protein [Anaerolineae bacterium]